MKFKLFLENVEKQRILAPIGSEHMEHLVKTQPITIDFGNFKETWYLFFTQWQSSNLDKEGGGGRILISPEPEGSFDGGILWIYENNKPKIVMRHVDQHAKIAWPYLVKAAKDLAISDS